MVLHRIRSVLVAVLAVTALAACGDDGSGPDDPVVATVRVTPATPSILVGDDIQFEATALTASGDTVDGKSFSWASNAATVASVNASTGLATGTGAGTAQITASVDGKSGTATLTVAVAGAQPTLTAISPSPLQVGGAATLTGTGFSATSQVYVNGVRATVSASTATSLQVTVPCVSPGQGAVTVRNGTTESAAFTATVNAGATSTPALGELMLVSNPMCVQLATASAQSYLIGVQSVSEGVGVLTPVTFGVETGGATVTSTGRMAAGLQRAPSVFGAVPPIVPHDETAARWRAHRSAELGLRARERTLMQPRFDAAKRFARERNVAAYSTTLSAAMMAEVGDTLQLRYPDPEANLCSDFAPVTGVVRHVSAQAIFVADITNPANGYVMSDYVNFGDLLDNRILATEIDYFGAPTDHDANGHVIVLFTKEVNEREGILGMVSSTDFFPRTGTNSCASSNEGEIYYGRAPDPTGSVGVAYPVEDARLDAPGLIAHEMTHIIQFGRRFDTPGATVFQALWELESQATLAEEVVGHDFNNLTVGQNYGFDIAWENCDEGSTATAWYCDKFSDLALYYGFQSATERADGAPEQCTWVGRQDDDDPQPCIHQRLPYTGWSFLRWLSDHYGAQLGGEQQLHRQMIENTTSGFATISNIVGEPIDQLLAHWAATLYTDDRFGGMDALLTLPSWNLTAISNELRETAQLAPYQHSFVDFAQDVTVRGGSNAYFLVSGSRSASAVRATTQTGATLPSHMRMWIVRVQ